MDPRYGTISMSDLLDDLAATDRAGERLAGFFADAESPGAIRTRGRLAAPEEGGSAKSGRDLLAKCGEETQRRYRTLMHVEAHFPEEGDHSILIGPTCQVMEAELDRMLTEPAQRIAGQLAQALRVRAKDRDQADLIEKWAAKRVPTTLGIQVVVLLALRRGCEHHVEAVEHFLNTHFQPRYVEMLVGKKLAICLDTVRRDFRNLACHGRTSFSADQYEQFTHLVVAQPHLDAWFKQGPSPDEPGPEAGIFHHHLALSQVGEGLQRTG